MTENLPILIAGVCASLLILLVLALIFSKQFRDAMLGGEGEAIVLGVLTVKGVAIILLCAIFAGGLIYPLYLQTTITPADCNQQISSILSPLEAYFSDTDPENIIRLTKQDIVSKNNAISECKATLNNKNTILNQSAKELEAVGNKLKQVQDSNDACQDELLKKDRLITQYQKDNKGLLAKLDKINSDIQEFYPAIDFSWDTDKKKKAAYRVLEVLRILGYYSAIPSNNPTLARQALIKFQTLKKILPKDKKKHGLLGRSTFLKFVEEYMAYENTVAKKGFQGILHYTVRP